MNEKQQLVNVLANIYHQTCQSITLQTNFYAVQTLLLHREIDYLNNLGAFIKPLENLTPNDMAEALIEYNNALYNKITITSILKPTIIPMKKKPWYIRIWRKRD